MKATGFLGIALALLSTSEAAKTLTMASAETNCNMTVTECATFKTSLTDVTISKAQAIYDAAVACQKKGGSKCKVALIGTLTLDGEDLCKTGGIGYQMGTELKSYKPDGKLVCNANVSGCAANGYYVTDFSKSVCGTTTGTKTKVKVSSATIDFGTTKAAAAYAPDCSTASITSATVGITASVPNGSIAMMTLGGLSVLMALII